MNRIEHLLTILVEECVETSQRATKALRFTLDEVQPGQEMTNAERLVYEFNDIVAIMEMLYDEELIPKVYDNEAIAAKKEKVEKFLKYSQQLGTLQQNVVIPPPPSPPPSRFLKEGKEPPKPNNYK